MIGTLIGLVQMLKSLDDPSQIGNLRAVPHLPGHTKVDSTVRYLMVELENALAISESVGV